MSRCCGDRKEKMTVLEVKGMTCSHCEMAVARAVSEISGVNNVKVDVKNGKVTVHHGHGVNLDRVKQAIEDLGYDVIG